MRQIYGFSHRADALIIGGNDAGLPAIKDTIQIVEKGSGPDFYEFRGIGYSLRKMSRPMSVEEKKSPGSIYRYVSTWSHSDNSEKRLFLNDLRQIKNRDGRAVSVSEIERLMTSGAIPLRTVVACQSYGQESLLPFKDISSIEVRRKKYAKWVGFSLGLVLDIVAISSINWDFDFSGAVPIQVE